MCRSNRQSDDRTNNVSIEPTCKVNLKKQGKFGRKGSVFNSEPEPDIVVVRGDTRQYLDRPDYSQRLDFRRSAVLPIIIEGVEIGAIDVNSLLP